jgi:hypothetical protein
MLERQEIDALLISALYGELTPTEETRLAAHLDAHPTDKTALAALTSTREAVRESRILTVQLDPPQSISALLMQEAARRAPKQEEREGWFARLAKSFMMHPAMAAAAMLVVVLGVATFVNNRKGDDIGKTSAPEYSSEPAVANQISAGSGSATDQTVVAAGDSPTGEGLAMGGKGGADSDSFKVGLAENTPPDPTKNMDRQVAASPEAAATDGKAVRRDEREKQQQEITTDKKKAEEKKDSSGGGEDAPATKGKAKKVVATKSPSGSYLELRNGDQPQPKEPDSGVANGRVYKYEDDLAKESVNAVTPGPRGGSGYAPAPPATGATSTATTAPKPDPKPADTTPPRTTVAQSPAAPRPGTATPQNTNTKVATTTGAGNTGPARNAPTQAPPRTQPSPPPPPAKVADSRAANATEKPRAAAPAEDKSANDPQLAWAREQHTAIVAKIRAGDCKGAANIAVVLANRDMAYYKTNVATDRSVKECLAYIDAARERDAEQRAERSRATQKRASEPAKATTKPSAADAAQFIK